MHVQSYLFFEGRCEEALDFYRRVLGAEIDLLMRFRDSPEPLDPAEVPPGSDDKVMHATFRIGDSTLMASDGNCSGQSGFQGVSLSITADSNEEAERLFAALSEGGQVQMPFGATFWAEAFGMLRDRFGVAWMVSGPS